MKKKLEELLKRELIGCSVKVIGKNIEGEIIDETRNMFIIRAKKGIKKIIKKNNNMKFTIGDEKIVVNGDKLIVRPEERIKVKL